MTTNQFYKHLHLLLSREYGADTIIRNIMFDKSLLAYYLKRHNQSLSTSIKDYIRFLRKCRLDIYPDAPSITRRVKMSGALADFRKEFH